MLSACGAPGNGPLIEKSSSEASVVAGQATPVDCAATCFRVTDQLVRDFGFDRANIHCGAPVFTAAHDCASCNRVFAQTFAVSLTSCTF